MMRQPNRKGSHTGKSPVVIQSHVNSNAKRLVSSYSVRQPIQ